MKLRSVVLMEIVLDHVLLHLYDYCKKLSHILSSSDVQDFKIYCNTVSFFFFFKVHNTYIITGEATSFLCLDFVGVIRVDW